jgi:hypothetical protein
VRKGVDKIMKARSKGSQSRIDSFFKVLPSVSTSTKIKRKTEKVSTKNKKPKTKKE